MEDEKEIICIDGIYYRFFLNKRSDEEQKADDCNRTDEASSVIDILLESYNSNRTYKHSFFVHSAFYGLIIGSKGATKNKIESETNTFIKMPLSGKEGDIVIMGSRGRNIVSARHRLNTIINSSKEKVSFTHFISIPMNDENIIAAYNDFKSNVLNSIGKNSRGVNETIFQNENKLHLTIQMLRLFDAEDIKQASETLHACREEIIEPFLEKTGPITIEAMGVNSMQTDPSEVNVLYVKILDKHGHLQELTEKMVNYFIAKDLMRGKCDTKTSVKLHMTIMNTKFSNKDDTTQRRRNWRKKDRVLFDATNIIEAHRETHFGEITLSTFHLSKMGEKDENGYYKVITKIDL